LMFLFYFIFHFALSLTAGDYSFLMHPSSLHISMCLSRCRSCLVRVGLLSSLLHVFSTPSRRTSTRSTLFGSTGALAIFFIARSSTNRSSAWTASSRGVAAAAGKSLASTALTLAQCSTCTSRQGPRAVLKLTRS